MKKVLSLVLALALVCALAVTVMAANVDLGVNAGVIGKGETVTVTVTLDEAVSIEAGSTAVQGNLYYDADALTYVSGVAGDGYNYLTIANNAKKSRVGFYYLSMTDPQVPVALPAGTVVVITFQANEVIDAADAAFSVTFGASDATGASVLDGLSDAASVKVCPNHECVVVDGTPGTCLEPGTATYACATCGYTYTETTGGDHTLVHVEAVEPACHFTGNIEHWYCTVCETVWQDEALTQITNHMNVILPALGGEVVHVEAAEPTCFEPGNIEHWYCESCEQVWQDEDLTQLTNHKNVVLPATGEGEVRHVAAAEATCTTDGHVEYWYCKECGQVWLDEALTALSNWKSIITEPAHGHIDEMDGDKEGSDGLCDICGGNAKTGDFGIIAAVASAVISMTGIVALPVAKKKFF